MQNELHVMRAMLPPQQVEKPPAKKKSKPAGSSATSSHFDAEVSHCIFPLPDLTADCVSSYIVLPAKDTALGSAHVSFVLCLPENFSTVQHTSLQDSCVQQASGSVWLLHLHFSVQQYLQACVNTSRG